MKWRRYKLPHFMCRTGYSFHVRINFANAFEIVSTVFGFLLWLYPQSSLICCKLLYSKEHKQAAVEGLLSRASAVAHAEFPPLCMRRFFLHFVVVSKTKL